MNGFWKEPEIRIDGAHPAKVLPHYEYNEAEGRLIVQLNGKAIVDV